MSDQDEGSKVTDDSWLRMMMKIGIPMAVISIASLWISQLMAVTWLFPLFVVTAGFALLMGLLYNVRFVLLSVRRSREQDSGGRS